MAQIASDNKPRIPDYRIRGFRNGGEIDQYLYRNPNSVIAAVEFHKHNNRSYAFSIQTNSTAKWFKGKFQDPNLYAQIPVQVAVEKALARKAVKQQIEWTVNIAEFPHPSANVSRCFTCIGKHVFE